MPSNLTHHGPTQQLQARVTRPLARKPGGVGSVIALQHTIGNRATGRLLARDTATTKPHTTKEPPPLDPNGDLAFALKYVEDYYQRAAFLLDLKNDITTAAGASAKTYLALKDPPSIADAVLGEIFKQALGLIPGGKMVTTALAAGQFALELRGLQKDLDESPIPGVSVEEERKKGPGEAAKKKAEKRYERGKKAYEIGKSVIETGLAAAHEKAKATQDEADAKEAANWQSGRIKDWRKARETLFAQNDALTAELELLVREGKNPGKIRETVIRTLGPFPKSNDKWQERVEGEVELAIYASKLQWVAEHDVEHSPGASYSVTAEYIPDPQTTPAREVLEFTGTEKKSASFENQIQGSKPSKALLRRIAELTGQPLAAESEFVAAQVLKLRQIHRRLDIHTLVMPPRAG